MVLVKNIYEPCPRVFYDGIWHDGVQCSNGTMCNYAHTEMEHTEKLEAMENELRKEGIKEQPMQNTDNLNLKKHECPPVIIKRNFDPEEEKSTLNKLFECYLEMNIHELVSTIGSTQNEIFEEHWYLRQAMDMTDIERYKIEIQDEEFVQKVQVQLWNIVESKEGEKKRAEIAWETIKKDPVTNAVIKSASFMDRRQLLRRFHRDQSMWGKEVLWELNKRHALSYQIKTDDYQLADLKEITSRMWHAIEIEYLLKNYFGMPGDDELARRYDHAYLQEKILLEIHINQLRLLRTLANKDTMNGLACLWLYQNAGERLRQIEMQNNMVLAYRVFLDEYKPTAEEEEPRKKKHDPTN